MNENHSKEKSDAVAGLEQDSQPSKKVQLAEMSAFLFLIAPSLVFSFLLIKPGNLSFVLTAVSTILRDLALVCLILYFLWRNDEPVVRIGWTRQNWLQEAALGSLLFVPLFYGAAVVEGGLSHVGFSVPKTPLPSLVPGKSLTHSALAFLLVAIVALAEETIFRGYLILRLKTVTGSQLAAVVLSAAIFSFGHGYEGSAGVLTVGVLGLAFALVYVWRQSLVAPIVMHFLQDLVVILVMPLLRAR
jgi:CAAX protease family protein